MTWQQSLAVPLSACICMQPITEVLIIDALIAYGSLHLWWIMHHVSVTSQSLGESQKASEWRQKRVSAISHKRLDGAWKNTNWQTAVSSFMMESNQLGGSSKCAFFRHKRSSQRVCLFHYFPALWVAFPAKSASLHIICSLLGWMQYSVIGNWKWDSPIRICGCIHVPQWCCYSTRV